MTALATPTPPTRSAVSPTSVRYWVKRSTLRSSAGEALVRLRIGQAQPVVPAHQRAWLQQAGRAQRLVAHEQARPEREAAGELVRLGAEHGAQLEGDGADGDASARLEIESRQQRGIDGGAEYLALAGERGGERLRGIERDRAVERIGAIDRLDLDQRGAPIVGARHRAHGGGSRHAAVRIEERALGRGHFAVAEIERQVAA